MRTEKEILAKAEDLDRRIDIGHARIEKMKNENWSAASIEWTTKDLERLCRERDALVWVLNY